MAKASLWTLVNVFGRKVIWQLPYLPEATLCFVSEAEAEKFRQRVIGLAETQHNLPGERDRWKPKKLRQEPKRYYVQNNKARGVYHYFGER